ncbi:HAD-IC family P-type ATPase [Streptomyces mirabilis]|uniref:HAD-IC family P-type ATPase n=1 Tax=Streptomyces mirabilis TaxID=68239 RepID=UPI00363BDFEB
MYQGSIAMCRGRSMPKPASISRSPFGCRTRIADAANGRLSPNEPPRTASAARVSYVPVGRWWTPTPAGGFAADLDDCGLDRLLPDVGVVARSTPVHKVRVVRAFQRLGRTVAMTGDGADDAPAIRLADIGIALGARATPAARAAADLLVTDDRLETVLDALVEGRAMWASVRQALAILVGGNLGEQPGRSRRYGPDVHLAVIATVTSDRPATDSQGTHRAIDHHLASTGISASQVGPILADLDLKPHLVRGWLTRPEDPDFYAKAAEVCALYLHGPPHSVVLGVDEKTAMQARSRRHPTRPAGPGRIERREFEHRRHGTVSIVAALAPGRSWSRTSPATTRQPSSASCACWITASARPWPSTWPSTTGRPMSRRRPEPGVRRVPE